MQHDYQGLERVLILVLTLISILPYLPTAYILAKQQKHKGNDIIILLALAISQLMYKVSLTFKYESLYLATSSWRKLLNIFTQQAFTSLLLNLARCPKHLHGYIFGSFFFLTIMLQEHNPLSATASLVPFLLNTLTFWYFHCFHHKGHRIPYVNTRTTIDGTLWYVLSIVAYVGAFHGLFDFYYFFQDMAVFSNGMSLFYTWQTYEKADFSISQYLGIVKGYFGENKQSEYGLVQSQKISKEDLERMRLKAQRKKNSQGKQGIITWSDSDEEERLTESSSHNQSFTMSKQKV
ncbi:hypothetical protein FGO68_gene3324 [Halteria grandinella]|uniref:Uncharacterized protein n=1 Tax=Halteria grandinella TaxID=5974 RepID=A0A8J8SW27_HALGN|nr:hypothetical protein FGO68_gene3324 [Halteria grandinella]